MEYGNVCLADAKACRETRISVRTSHRLARTGYWEQKGNPKPGVLNFIGATIEAGCKRLYTMSPTHAIDVGQKDFSNMAAAYKQAYEYIQANETGLLKSIEGTGWDREQFLSDVMNNVVDGKYPQTEDNIYNNFVYNVGKVIIRKGNNQQKTLNTND